MPPLAPFATTPSIFPPVLVTVVWNLRTASLVVECRRATRTTPDADLTSGSASLTLRSGLVSMITRSPNSATSLISELMRAVNTGDGDFDQGVGERALPAEYPGKAPYQLYGLATNAQSRRGLRPS